MKNKVDKVEGALETADPILPLSHLVEPKPHLHPKKSKERLSPLRVTVGKVSQEQLNEMLLSLRCEGSHVTISASQLTDWIIRHFYKKDFGKLKGSIAKEYLNPRKYLESMAKNINGFDSLEVILREGLKQIKPPKGSKCLKGRP